MLDASLKTQLQAYLERLTRPVHLVASLDEGDSSAQMLQLLQDIEALSPKVSLEVRRDDAQVGHLADEIREPLGRGEVVAVVAHVEQHDHPAPRDRAVHGDGRGLVDGQLLEVGVDLEPAQAERLRDAKLNR